MELPRRSLSRRLLMLRLRLASHDRGCLPNLSGTRHNGKTSQLPALGRTTVTDICIECSAPCDVSGYLRLKLRAEHSFRFKGARKLRPVCRGKVGSGKGRTEGRNLTVRGRGPVTVLETEP